MTKDKRRFTSTGDATEVLEQEKAEAQQLLDEQWEIEPLQKWVLIRKVEREEKLTEGGVVLPGGGRSSRGFVVAAAKEVPLEAGDLVIFTNFPIELEDLEELTGDSNLKLVRYEEVYARFRKKIDVHQGA